MQNKFKLVMWNLGFGYVILFKTEMSQKCLRFVNVYTDLKNLPLECVCVCVQPDLEMSKQKIFKSVFKIFVHDRICKNVFKDSANTYSESLCVCLCV